MPKISLWWLYTWAVTIRLAECLVNELCSWVKERWKVEGRQVIGRHTIIADSGAIEVITALATHFSMGCIQHMCYPQDPQTIPVMGHVPVDYSADCLWYHESEHLPNQWSKLIFKKVVVLPSVFWPLILTRIFFLCVQLCFRDYLCNFNCNPTQLSVHTSS